MESGLLSLKWNNHGSTFFHVLSTIRRKESYCDVTLTCEGKFYPVHKLVLSTCSEYFEEIFSRTQCKHPVIVLKDIKHDELEALLNYMYLGEVNVLQADLAGLIKAAECLRIKGLAVPDEAPTSKSAIRDAKRSASVRDVSPQQNKRARQEEDIRTSIPNLSFEESSKSHRELSREQIRTNAANRVPSQSPGEGFSNSGFSQSGHSQDSPRERRESRERPPDTDRPNETRQKDVPPTSSSSQPSEVIVPDEPVVKTEVLEEPKEEEDEENVMNSDSSIAYDPLSSGMQGDGVSEGPPGFDPQTLTSQPQTMEELVAQAMPGTSGMQGDSMSSWGGGQAGGGGGDLSRFNLESFQLDDTQNSSQGSSQQMECLDGEGPADPRGYPRPSVPHGHTSLTPEELLPKNPWPCPHPGCDYVTHCESKLKMHFRKHTGEKPFTCPYCSFKSAQKGNLNVHIRKYHYPHMFDVPVKTDSNVINPSFQT